MVHSHNDSSVVSDVYPNLSNVCKHFLVEIYKMFIQLNIWRCSCVVLITCIAWHAFLRFHILNTALREEVQVLNFGSLKDGSDPWCRNVLLFFIHTSAIPFLSWWTCHIYCFYVESLTIMRALCAAILWQMSDFFWVTNSFSSRFSINTGRETLLSVREKKILNEGRKQTRVIDKYKY